MKHKRLEHGLVVVEKAEDNITVDYLQVWETHCIVLSIRLSWAQIYNRHEDIKIYQVHTKYCRFRMKMSKHLSVSVKVLLLSSIGLACAGIVLSHIIESVRIIFIIIISVTAVNLGLQLAYIYRLAAEVTKVSCGN